MNKGRKISSGKYHANRKKKKFEKKIQERVATIKETKRKQIRIRGGNKKTVLLNAKVCNLKTKEGIKKAEIKNVLETPQNTFLARQNRLTKGAIIQTDKGKARITNRPTQEGCVNAILIE